MPGAYLGHAAERAEPAVRRVDLRQPVVVAPALPDVLHEDRVCQPVPGSLLEPLGRLGVVPAPLVDAHPAQQTADSLPRPEAVQAAVVPGGGKGTARGGDQHEGGVVRRLQCEHAFLGAIRHLVRVHIRCLKQAQPVCVVRTHVPGREREPAFAHLERFRPLHHVAEAHVGTMHIVLARPQPEAREAWVATAVTRHVRHGEREEKRPLAGPELRYDRDLSASMAQGVLDPDPPPGGACADVLHVDARAPVPDCRLTHLHTETAKRQGASAVGEHDGRIRYTVRAGRDPYTKDTVAAVQAQSPGCRLACQCLLRRGTGLRQPAVPVVFTRVRRHPSHRDRRRAPEPGVAHGVAVRARPGPELHGHAPARVASEVDRGRLPDFGGGEPREELLLGLASLGGVDPEVHTVAGRLLLRVVADRRPEAQDSRFTLGQFETELRPHRPAAGPVAPGRMNLEPGQLDPPACPCRRPARGAGPAVVPGPPGAEDSLLVSDDKSRAPGADAFERPRPARKPHQRGQVLYCACRRGRSGHDQAEVGRGCQPVVRHEPAQTHLSHSTARVSVADQHVGPQH